jgi:tetratricopeptide (TPR) repeat protein
MPGTDPGRVPQEVEAEPAIADERLESIEVDLGIVLEEIGDDRADGGAAAVPSGDPGHVFTEVREEESSRRTTSDAAEEKYRQGVAMREAGRVGEAIALLQAASRAPRLRFVTASLLGRIYREKGMMPEAIEWLERAAQAPSPTAEEGSGLLYDLADALEAVGEAARALAICLELQAEAGDYRDVAARIDRLARVQARR